MAEVTIAGELTVDVSTREQLFDRLFQTQQRVGERQALINDAKAAMREEPVDLDKLRGVLNRPLD